jgi:hypothetical protein
MAFDALGIGNSAVASSIVGPTNAPASGRGVSVQLGKRVGLDLNAVAATTIFTTPASGFTRCVVTEIIVDNFSLAATTASVSYGASGTPTDWAATATMAGANTNKFVQLSGGPAATASATYGTAVAFVANVTIAQGVAATADVSCWGYYL